ncbi:hypothetical protein ACTXT7_006397 [Hymenolepis weldensis]
MILGGPGCRLQTCSRLAPEQFDSAFSAFIGCGDRIDGTSNVMLRLASYGHAWPTHTPSQLNPPPPRPTYTNIWLPIKLTSETPK